MPSADSQDAFPYFSKYVPIPGVPWGKFSDREVRRIWPVWGQKYWRSDASEFEKRFNPVLMTEAFAASKSVSSSQMKGLQGYARQCAAKRPLIRKRSTGLVGPEPDWSVVYSDVPRNWIHSMVPSESHPTKDGKYYRFAKGDMLHLVPYGSVSASMVSKILGGVAETWLFRHESDVKRWTFLANLSGICYSGERGYTPPTKEGLKRLHSYLDSLQDTEVRVTDLIDSVVKSEKLRSSAKRKRYKARHRSIPTTIPLQSTVSQKEAFLAWCKTGKSVGISEFRRSLRESAPSCLSFSKSYSPVSKPVIDALTRIYSQSNTVITLVQPPSPSPGPPEESVFPKERILPPQDGKYLSSLLKSKNRVSRYTNGFVNILGGVSLHPDHPVFKQENFLLTRKKFTSKDVVLLGWKTDPG